MCVVVAFIVYLNSKISGYIGCLFFSVADLDPAESEPFFCRIQIRIRICRSNSGFGNLQLLVYEKNRFISENSSVK
jgi:hypothetical protein